MITVGTFEAKTKFSELLDRVERGEKIIVTRHGKSVAQISPVDSEDRDAQVQATLDRLARLRSVGQEIARHNQGNPVTVEDLLSWRDEGRR